MSWIFHGASIFSVGGVSNHSISRDIMDVLDASTMAATISRVIFMVKLLYLSKIRKPAHIMRTAVVKNNKNICDDVICYNIRVYLLYQ